MGEGEDVGVAAAAAAAAAAAEAARDASLYALCCSSVIASQRSRNLDLMRSEL